MAGAKALRRHRELPYARLAACCMGLLFLAAAVMKCLRPGGAATLYGSLATASPAFAWGIIAVETALGLWLITGIARAAAAGAAIFVLSLFSCAIALDLAARHPEPCGCFGAAWSAAHSPGAIERGLAMGVGRNLLLIVVCATLYLGFPAVRPDSSAASPAAGPTD